VLQDWVKQKGLRVVVVFEGRDAAGKGGVIRAITHRVSPRVFRVVALPVPSDREKSQLYFQRFVPHFPATSCSKPRTRNLRPGTLCPRMTSGGRASTVSVTCSTRSLTSGSLEEGGGPRTLHAGRVR